MSITQDHLGECVLRGEGGDSLSLFNRAALCAYGASDDESGSDNGATVIPTHSSPADKPSSSDADGSARKLQDETPPKRRRKSSSSSSDSRSRSRSPVQSSKERRHSKSSDGDHASPGRRESERVSGSGATHHSARHSSTRHRDSHHSSRHSSSSKSRAKHRGSDDRDGSADGERTRRRSESPDRKHSRRDRSESPGSSRKPPHHHQPHPPASHGQGQDDVHAAAPRRRSVKFAGISPL